MKLSLDQLYEIFIASEGVETDTRKDLSGKIFFALKGENFDGNDFVEQALQQGALLAVTSRPQFKDHPQMTVVDDTLKTLQKLALHHRLQMKAKIIAITGSNGKTTTKELIKNVLSQQYQTLATQGNLNNHIGIPLTLLQLKPHHEIAVIEMGINHFGEMTEYCQFTRPDYGYITSFGEAHLEFFGDLQGVIRAKSELYDYLKTHNKLIFQNADDPIQIKQLENYLKIYSFSYIHPAPVQLKQLSQGQPVKIGYKGLEITTHLYGTFHFSNAGAAICIGDYFQVSPQNIKQGIETYIPSNNRNQWIEKDNNRIILDAYNANPSSMKAALDTLAALPGKKLAILGDMFELGPKSLEKHQNIVDYLSQKGIQAYLIGENFSRTIPNPYILGQFSTREEFTKQINLNNFSNHTILIKASRGMALEKILED